MELFENGRVVKVCAPMVRYSKLAFRSLVRKYDCDLCFSPMIVAADFIRSAKARDSELTTNSSDRPLIIQFAATEAQTLATAAGLVAPFSDGVDLNCGCPQRWAMAEGYGACLMNKPQVVKDMVRHVRNQVDKPNYGVSVKIRIHKDVRKTVDLCQKAEAAGVSWITVHGRTSDERHQPVHYDVIRVIKESLGVPVIANGDIKTPGDIEAVRELTGVDGMEKEMTLQWTAVALFLYVEMGILLLLCLPFISAIRWQTIFNLNIWNQGSWLWKRGFLAMIIILIVLFLDAVREVRKYSGTQIHKESKLYPNVFDHVHMKLFRAQRNLYISGFALLLWLVMRRVITLISQLAEAANTKSALQVQIEDANKAAKKYMEESEQLKQASHHSAGDEQTAQVNEQLRKQVCQLTQELKTSAEALNRSESQAEAIKIQAAALARDYDQLLQSQNQLQRRTETEDKKDI
ncbi:tRNA-dihydrouridine(20a/20b) synthase [NAD(P)+]-like isoform X2 [Tachysurus fulvidraco]|uniref:tRNA-dihydrouridine(20a/20b) synthase [NAD(P)+]-like isoform X2 n=1 Tax=Tachysurus fulvidraco TaxID=1234273 RepID=UPI001FED68E3|nr:tRNA-dihydrouridine(20a/20b) synthase [NAD(P)+]-like isoform X2 [Tachysurus fulvidraco]